jgi:hypothetical protein
MAKKDENKDPFGPVRKTDPYVSGNAYGNSGGDDGNSGDKSCGEMTAKLAVGVTTAFLLTRLALRSLKS